MPYRILFPLNKGQGITEDLEKSQSSVKKLPMELTLPF
jgi:hypothetical protein